MLVEYTDEITQKEALDTLVSYEKEIIFVNKWKVSSRSIKLPMAFEDKKTLDAVKRYQETIRSEAPWLPNNVDFIANINGITRTDVKDMLYTARFLVLGLGDVFLGAPCAVPLDQDIDYWVPNIIHQELLLQMVLLVLVVIICVFIPWNHQVVIN